MSSLRPLLVGTLVVLGVSLIHRPPAGAATVGTGDLTVDVSPAGLPRPYTGAIDFDDLTFDLFGVPVNVGQDVGRENVSGGIFLQSFGGTFTAHGESITPGELTGDAAGDFLCPDNALCISGPVSLVGTFSSLVGTVTSSWPGGLTYIFDGTVTFVGVVLGNYRFTGRIAFNAFQPATTEASPSGCSGSACEVVVTPDPTTIVNSATGAEVVVDTSITFPLVTAAGDTTVTAVSNVAGQLQANFAFNDDVTYLDISTTAVFDTSGDSIEICVDYAIAGTVADPLALRFMHLEGGVWVDVTSYLDTTTQTICGRTTSLSPFGVAVRTGCTGDADCDDSNPCSSDTCDAGTCTHAAANAGASCRTALNECDIAETCDGSSTACPANGFVTSGAGCTDDGDTCTDDVCNGSGVCTHPSNGSCTTTTTTTSTTTTTETTTTSTTETTTTTAETTTSTAETTTSTTDTTTPTTAATTSTTTSTAPPTTLPANLHLTRADLRAQKSPGSGNGGVRIGGDFTVPPLFSVPPPFTVHIEDGGALDRSHTFTSCSTRGNGQVRCSDSGVDGRFRATLTPLGASRVRFRMTWLGQTIDGPFSAPVQVTLTHNGGVGRTGTIAACRQAGSRLSCREH
jgi:hypothetical protein